MAIITVSGYCKTSNRYTPNGTYVLECVVADKVWNYKDQEEETRWVKATWFGERAEKLSNSLMKAKMVTITGREDYKIYQDKIDRVIDPLDHRILLFQQDESSQEQGPRNPGNYYDDSFPPPQDDDIPFL